MVEDGENSQSITVDDVVGDPAIKDAVRFLSLLILNGQSASHNRSGEPDEKIDRFGAVWQPNAIGFLVGRPSSLGQRKRRNTRTKKLSPNPPRENKTDHSSADGLKLSALSFANYSCLVTFGIPGVSLNQDATESPSPSTWIV